MQSNEKKNTSEFEISTVVLFWTWSAWKICAKDVSSWWQNYTYLYITYLISCKPEILLCAFQLSS